MTSDISAAYLACLEECHQCSYTSHVFKIIYFLITRKASNNCTDKYDI